jgi:hypothetical protein
MKRAKGIGRGDVPGQLQIDWRSLVPSVENPRMPADSAVAPLVQRLKWDFGTSFPQPMPEAIDAGIVSDEDATPEGIRSIHDEHARELLMTLHDLDAVLNARRRGVDPATGKPAPPFSLCSPARGSTQQQPCTAPDQLVSLRPRR